MSEGMTNPPLDLLARLASGVTPDRGCVEGRTPLESVSFNDLLAQARRGELSSGLPVEVPTGFDVHLNTEQQDALSRAVDAAAAAGSGRLLAFADEAVLTVDVTSRTVVDVQSRDTEVLTDFDAAVFLPVSTESSDGGGGVVGSREAAVLPEGVRNTSLQSLLAEIQKDDHSSRAG